MSNAAELVNDFFQRDARWKGKPGFLSLGELSEIELPQGSDGSFMAAVSCDHSIVLVNSVLGIEGENYVEFEGEIDGSDSDSFFVLTVDKSLDVGSVELMGEIRGGLGSKAMRSIRDLERSSQKRLASAIEGDSLPSWATGDDLWVERVATADMPVLFVGDDGETRVAVEVAVSDDGDVILMCRDR